MANGGSADPLADAAGGKLAHGGRGAGKPGVCRISSKSQLPDIEPRPPKGQRGGGWEARWWFRVKETSRPAR